MAYNNLTSLTPSRPAPTPPTSRPSQSSTTRTNSSSSSRTTPSSSFSSTAYASSFPILNPSSALGPAPPSGRNTVVRTGPASVKEEGLRSFMWSKRWLVLGGSELQIFKNEVGCALTHYTDSRDGIEADSRAYSAIILPGFHLFTKRRDRCPASRPKAILRRTRNQR